MIWTIFLEIIVNWLVMGALIALALIGCLYFAILCEKIVDRVFRS
jgi:hypothetical protein